MNKMGKEIIEFEDLLIDKNDNLNDGDNITATAKILTSLLIKKIDRLQNLVLSFPIYKYFNNSIFFPGRNHFS